MVGETWDYCGIKDVTENIYTDGQKFYLIAKEANTPSLMGRVNSGDVVVELSKETICQIKRLEQLTQSEQAILQSTSDKELHRALAKICLKKGDPISCFDDM